MEYLKKSFSVALGGEGFGEGWERTFGKKHEASNAAPDSACECVEDPCPCACHAASLKNP